MQRLPDYLKRPIIDTEKTRTVRKILKNKCLNTVCDGARCPNKGECYAKNTATFLIMGNVCTRNCRYCNISTAKPEPLDINEPKHVAEAVKELGDLNEIVSDLLAAYKIKQKDNNYLNKFMNKVSLGFDNLLNELSNKSGKDILKFVIEICLIIFLILIFN